MGRYQIKLRCLSLGVTMSSLMVEVRKRAAVPLTPGDWSRMVNGWLQTPKAERLLSIADEILTEWETASKK